MRQLRQLGSPFKYLGSPSSQHRDALNLARDAAEGIWAVADFVPGASEVNKKYGDAYKKEYNVVQIEKGQPKLLKIVNVTSK